MVQSSLDPEQTLNNSRREEARPAPILLLHGGWGGAWCWAPVTQPLIAAGHAVAAPDLIGGGLKATEPRAFLDQDEAGLATEPSPLSALSIETYAASALVTLHELHEAYGPVIVVGHSITGVLVHYLGERAPEAIRRLVYLAAIAPRPGHSVVMDEAEQPWATSLFPSLIVADPAVVGVLRINPSSTDPAYRNLVRRCFFNDVSDTQAAVAMRLLTCENPAALSLYETTLTAQRWGSLARSWIRTANDASIPVTGQDTNIRQLDEDFPDHPFDVTTIDSGHMAFLSKPHELTHAILEAASQMW
jgi:pimeloyl-ACP methyl ester carboxylesterase